LQKQLPWHAQRKTFHPVHVIGGWSFISTASLITLLGSGSHGQYHSILKLNAVSQVYAVLGHSWLLQMTQSDVPVVFLDPGLNGMPS
jgi:hypothetical protein